MQEELMIKNLNVKMVSSDASSRNIDENQTQSNPLLYADRALLEKHGFDSSLINIADMKNIIKPNEKDEEFLLGRALGTLKTIEAMHKQPDPPETPDPNLSKQQSSF